MKFLVDAHLPRRLAYQLRAFGHEAVHTLDLPRGNRTPDPELGDLFVRDHAIVVTKDADFVNTFTVQHSECPISSSWSPRGTSPMRHSKRS